VKSCLLQRAATASMISDYRVRSRLIIPRRLRVAAAVAAAARWENKEALSLFHARFLTAYIKTRSAIRERSEARVRALGNYPALARDRIN
jgi:hypothetical protein